MALLNLPAKMDFTMGSTEQKMDMTLDDIIKLNRKTTMKQRIPNKVRFKNTNTNTNTNTSARKGATAPPGRAWNGPAARAGNGQAARAAFQRSVAAKSSKLRQGKLAEVRARNGAGNFAATQAAGKRAFATAVTPRNSFWMKSSDVRHAKQRPGFGQRLTAYNASGSNMKISVVNNGSKVGVPRFSTAPAYRKNGPNAAVRQVRNDQNTDRMDIDQVQSQAQKQKAKTLDSLFAEIKERRNSQQQGVQRFTAVDRNNRRGGGRPGYQGRRS